MISTPSLNQLANERKLAPFASWDAGVAPVGYFRRPVTEEAARFFQEQGYLVVEDGLDEAEIVALNRETARICRGERGAIWGVTPADPEEPDDEVMRRYLCIHFPHKVSAEMYGTLAHPAIVEVLTSVIGPNVKCMQSMLFVKASGKPGQAWHQDEFFIPTRDRSLTGAWIALDDAHVENGCLWVIPGSHRHGIIWPQHAHDDRRFDCAGEAMYFPYTDDDALPVEVKRGSIVFFNGYLLHRSLPNYAASGFRRALVNHYMSAESLLPWFGFEPGTSIATADYRDIVLVAGRDPYAWKGIEERAGAPVRPSGEGGCGNTERNAEAAEDEHDDH
ncbi:MAG TPA: phytanoyl-CoA dioxygenase family protein [Ardenticatenaceae bacterium]|nr:phytanoyl-CoA dioxygenase family protein [Ardenticatenaceae bacterium]